MRLILASLFLCTTGLAVAGPLRPMAIDLPGKKPRPSFITAPAAPASRLLYVHRCPTDTGCVVREATVDDSRQDQSVLAMGTRTIRGFRQGDAVWNQVMDCVRATFAPFNIGVTDVDPGNVPHYENIVGGTNSDLRDDIPDAGGVAPSVCLDVPNAMTFTFDVWGANANVICAVVAQETAHALGLEHEINPADPMTYLNGPYPRRFQAADTACGEYQARACDCAAGMQNSYEYLLAMFGPGIPTAPTVSVDSPASGKKVQPHFITRVTATDDVAVAKVELLIDGVIVAESRMPPYKLIAPDLAEGAHTLEVTATDVQGTPATTAPIQIDLGPPCTAAAGCEGTDVCVQGLCVAGPDRPGGLGAFCQANTECVSGQCQTDASSGDHFCVEACDLSPGSCPDGFSCIAEAGAGVCWPADSSGCCDAGVRHPNPAGALLLGLGIVVLIVRRRRR